MRSVIFYAGLLGCFAQVKAQNVGIGTPTPTEARLTIVDPSGNQFVSRTSLTGPGISIYQASGSPTLGFNNKLTPFYGYMGSGYGSFFQYDTATGKLRYFSSTAGGAANTNMVTTTQSLLTITADGNVGIGISNPTEGLHLKGKNVRIENTSGVRTIQINSYDGSSGEMIFYDPTDNASTLEIDGDFGGTGRSRIIVDELQIKGGADFAEYFDVAATSIMIPEPGMLVSIDEKNEGKLMVSNTAYDKKVAGIISGANGIKPGMMMGHKGTIANGEYPVAITGRVYVLAEAVSSAILPGDLLTTSAIAGHAMRAANRKKAPGAIIGKAMSTLEKGTKGMVLVLLGIQ